MKREIPRDSPAPHLDAEAVQLITRVCFGVADDLSRSCEAIMAFGVSDPVSQRECRKAFCMAVHTTAPSVAYIVGGSPHGTVAAPGESEAEQLLREIGPKGYPSIEFRIEKASTNTLENVTNCLPLGLAGHESMLLISKEPHAGRCRLTLMKYAPAMDIRSRGYPTRLKGSHAVIARDRWNESPEHRDAIWSEFLRIKTYGERGDIAYPDDVRSAVDRVFVLACPAH